MTKQARVFTARDGNKEVEFEWSGFHAAHLIPLQWQGWRERVDGNREEVVYSTENGWLNERERSELASARAFLQAR